MNLRDVALLVEPGQVQDSLLAAAKALEAEARG